MLFLLYKESISEQCGQTNCVAVCAMKIRARFFFDGNLWRAESDCAGHNVSLLVHIFLQGRI
jgi:hypothetical protein